MRLPPRALLVIVTSFAFVRASAVHLGTQGIQPLPPQGPVPAQPFIDLGEWIEAKTVDPPLRLLADLDQPRFPQHPQLARYPGRATGSSAASSCRTASMPSMDHIRDETVKLPKRVQACHA
jgi:hypothetical protein